VKADERLVRAAERLEALGLTLPAQRALEACGEPHADDTAAMAERMADRHEANRRQR
jgi:hypothetical protein